MRPMIRDILAIVLLGLGFGILVWSLWRGWLLPMALGAGLLIGGAEALRRSLADDISDGG